MVLYSYRQSCRKNLTQSSHRLNQRTVNQKCITSIGLYATFSCSLQSLTFARLTILTNLALLSCPTKLCTVLMLQTHLHPAAAQACGWHICSRAEYTIQLHGQGQPGLHSSRAVFHRDCTISCCYSIRKVLPCPERGFFLSRKPVFSHIFQWAVKERLLCVVSAFF